MFIHITSKRFWFGIPCLYFCFIVSHSLATIAKSHASRIWGCAPGVLMTRKPCLDGEMEINVGKITVPKGAEIVICGKQTHLTGKASDSMWLMEKNRLGPWIWWNLPGWNVVKLDHSDSTTSDHGWSTNIPSLGPVSSPEKDFPGKPMVFSARKTSHEAPSPNKHNQSDSEVERCWKMGMPWMIWIGIGVCNIYSGLPRKHHVKIIAKPWCDWVFFRFRV